MRCLATLSIFLTVLGLPQPCGAVLSTEDSDPVRWKAVLRRALQEERSLSSEAASALDQSEKQASSVLDKSERLADNLAAAVAAGDVEGLLGEPTSHPLWDFRWEVIHHAEVAWCALLLFFTGILCSAAGIGGGAMYVTALMLVGKLSPRDAIPLSKAIVFLGAVSSALVTWNSRRNASPGQKADYDLDVCRLVIPSALVGTFIGVLWNWFTSDYVVMVMLTSLLVLVSVLVIRQAILQHKAEQNAEASPALAFRSSGTSWAEVNSEEEPLIQASNPQEEETEESMTHPEAWLSEQEMVKLVPSSTDLRLSVFLLVVVVFSGVLRFHMHACREEAARCKHPVTMTLFGGRMALWMANKSTAEFLQFMALSTPLCCCMAVAGYYASEVRSRSRWTVQRVVGFQALATATGTFAGLAGIGGGLILCPFFILTGMPSQVAVGSSSICVLFTSASTAFQYAFTDRVIMPLALVYGGIAIVASQLGSLLMRFVQEKWPGRQSYVTIIVAQGVLLSAVFSFAKFHTLIKSNAM